jgi:hypothetical protein
MWFCNAAAGSAGNTDGHSASIAASTVTTRPRWSTNSASSRRCSMPTGVTSRPLEHAYRTEHLDPATVSSDHATILTTSRRRLVGSNR